MKKLAVIILAAGQGKRMKSERAKALHPLLGRPMLSYPLAVARALRAERTVVVVGVGADEVKSALAAEPVVFAPQKEQLGTGHAVMAAMPALKGFNGDVYVQYGDSPLLRPETAAALVKLHRQKRDALTLLTTQVEDPFGYGRILRDPRGKPRAIVEEKDCDPEQRLIREINPGFYVYDAGFLKQALPRLKNQNRQHEYYLTDLVELAAQAGARVNAMLDPDPDEVLGVNSRPELAHAAAILRRRINQAHGDAGVTILDPASTYIEPGVTIGRDATLEPGAMLIGSTVIGPGATIEANARIADSTIGAGVTIEAGARLERARIERGARIKAYTVIEDAEVKAGAQVGPMAHLRPGSSIGEDARIGNFVETKKALLARGVKASHLSYIGDAKIGRNVNLGCGFITCNYDGVTKSLTVIEDNVFVGSDSQAVAPVTIGHDAYIGSGSTITHDVPPGALAFTRAPLTLKPGWPAKKFGAPKKPPKSGKESSKRRERKK